VIAGSADVISFLGLGGLFVAHVTGNLAILAAHLVTGNRIGVGLLLSVPAFVLVLALTRLLAAGLDAAGVATLRPLLLLQLLLLAGFLALGSPPARTQPECGHRGRGRHAGVAAMAIQNALAQLSLPGAPPRASAWCGLVWLVMVGRIGWMDVEQAQLPAIMWVSEPMTTPDCRGG
jgi:uncharacterized membrane protein YoaK (UPF0700 family)